MIRSLKGDNYELNQSRRAVQSSYEQFAYASDRNNNHSSRLVKGEANGDGATVNSLAASLKQHEQYQQMQQLLQQHVFTPHQLQQLMKQQTAAAYLPMTMSAKDQPPQPLPQHFDTTKKQLEQLMQQIQEQLQMNFIQQTHLIQQQQQNSPKMAEKSTNSDKKLHMNNGHSKSPATSPATTIGLQQKLAFQQQELIQQFQLVQRQYFLHQGGIGLQPLLLAQQQQQQQQHLQSE